MRLEALGQFEVALVESRVAPTGPLDAPAWVAYWRDLHANFRDGTCCFDMPVQWAGVGGGRSHQRMSRRRRDMR